MEGKLDMIFKVFFLNKNLKSVVCIYIQSP